MLSLALLNVLFDGDGGRSNIATVLEGFASTGAPEFRQSETVGNASDQIARCDLNAFLVPQRAQRLIHNGERQPGGTGNITAQQGAVQVQLLQYEISDLSQLQSTLRQR